MPSCVSLRRIHCLLIEYSCLAILIGQLFVVVVFAVDLAVAVARFHHDAFVKLNPSIHTDVVSVNSILALSRPFFEIIFSFFVSTLIALGMTIYEWHHISLEFSIRLDREDRLGELVRFVKQNYPNMPTDDPVSHEMPPVTLTSQHWLFERRGTARLLPRKPKHQVLMFSLCLLIGVLAHLFSPTLVHGRISFSHYPLFSEIYRIFFLTQPVVFGLATFGNVFALVQEDRFFNGIRREVAEFLRTRRHVPGADAEVFLQCIGNQGLLYLVILGELLTVSQLRYFITVLIRDFFRLRNAMVPFDESWIRDDDGSQASVATMDVLKRPCDTTYENYDDYGSLLSSCEEGP